MTAYTDWLAQKSELQRFDGLAVDRDEINPALFPFQADLVLWALGRGRACLFADTGLGKTFMQCEWARVVSERVGRVLIVAPLAVAQQTVREAARFGISVVYLRADDGVSPIVICNYEMLSHFSATNFSGVVLDESSILKAYGGKTRTEIVEMFARTAYKLACTATPAPNDYTELGNHAEFCGVKTRVEMLSEYFCHDGGDTSTWRLKGHARDAYWAWVCSWAAVVRMPSDLGYDDGGFALPKLIQRDLAIDLAPEDAFAKGQLFHAPALGLNDQRSARKGSLSERVAAIAAAIAEDPDEPAIVWCELNAESSALAAAIPGAVEVTGSQDNDTKAAALLGFADGGVRVLVTKPSIAGFGMNWQRCARVYFIAPSNSYEQTYQAIRRCWRFGQARPVIVSTCCTEEDRVVKANVARKAAEARTMQDAMIAHVQRASYARRDTARREWNTYSPGVAMAMPEWLPARDLDAAHCEAQDIGEAFAAYRGDCVELIAGLADASIGYSVFSPPFASLYTYSSSMRDMGNCDSHEEFFQHFGFLAAELLRVTKPGRLCSMHCMLLPTTKTRDGYIGLADFRGDLIRAMTAHGWIHHSEVVIWKDPVTAMQRTKALGLLHKQIKKDSCMSRQGVPDYVVTMRAPGVNPDPVTHTNTDLPVELWQRYASPVWMDINPSETLQRASAREDEDERHICPLQLDVVRRLLHLWTRPNDVVLSPFAGIGSEGHVALDMGRRFIGFELKVSYYKQAVQNLHAVDAGRGQLGLFA